MTAQQDAVGYSYVNVGVGSPPVAKNDAGYVYVNVLKAIGARSRRLVQGALTGRRMRR